MALPRLARDAEDVVSAYLAELLEQPHHLARYRPASGTAGLRPDQLTRDFARFILNDLVRFVRSNPLFWDRVRNRPGTVDYEERVDSKVAEGVHVPPEPEAEPDPTERPLRAIARLSKSELSDREYDVVALQIEGQEPDEIASALGTSVAGVTRTARRALTKIRHVFELYSHRSEALVGQPFGDVVECSIFGPRATAPGTQAFIQVFVHTPQASEEALRLAKEYDDVSERLGKTGLWSRISDGTKLTFKLAAPGLEVHDDVQTMIWRGKAENVSFAVTVPAHHTETPVIGTVVVAANTVPIGHIKFKLSVRTNRADSRRTEDLGQQAKRYEMAFISSAAKDRTEVLKRVQMLREFGMNYFQDVLDLEPGQRWAQQLYKHIDDCDLFLLFWSSAAKASEWVLKEARYAIARKNGNDDAPPAIHPVIIEGPPIVPPPPELQHLHFNDRLIYFMTPTEQSPS